MILRRVRLENIRSYPSGEVNFPEGSVLLSGDIGSGKSTILLAVDFALFGIQKDLSGAGLLRHGKDSGAVELEFSIGGKDYTIKRTLKRKGDSVRQATGYIISGGSHKDLTAEESKAFILNLLGYPPQALKKDTALLYRYTVYAPQEQMKQIIEADPEERLDLIRRLFGIDKYKRIAENAEIYAKDLRDRARELAGSITDLDEKRRQQAELVKESEKGAHELKKLKERAAQEEEAVRKSKKWLDELQEKIEAAQKKKQEYASKKAGFDALKSEGSRLKSSYEEIDPKLAAVEEKLKVFKELKKPAVSIKEIESKISLLEKSEKEALSKAASLETEARSLSAIFDKGVCGTCKQKVADKESFKKGIDEKKAEIMVLKNEQAKLHTQIEGLRKETVGIQNYDSLTREKASFEERKTELTQLKSKYKKEFEENQGKLRSLADAINKLALEIKSDTLSQEFKEQQKAYEELRSVKEATQRQESVIKEKLEGIGERIELLSKEILKKESAKRDMDECKARDAWLREFFVKLMADIEKHVMASVQHEFNSLFQKWFSMLVMDEGLSARVDERFSVVVEQDGFETAYTFMSGGERTAVALAYRLSLNRVINDLIEKIKTKDLLILDEPTDGFSSDQMDSVRDVLAELKNRQTIIVSHEQKIESFVDKTIRFVKESGISRAL